VTASQQDPDGPEAPQRGPHPGDDASPGPPPAPIPGSDPGTPSTHVAHDPDAHADRSPGGGSGPLLDDALDLVRFLRARCEWDAAQTPQSLLPYLLEEAHETADAVAAGNDRELVGELGDLLLNVAFQVVLAEERGAFTAADVIATLQAKMRRRHPHLYGDGPRIDWETQKKQERDDLGTGVAPLLDGIGSGLEPLSRAQRMQERVATVGFDWPSAHGAFDKVVEEVEEVRELIASADAARLEEELGDLLFAVVNLARLSGAHAMRALVQANTKFARRFEALEALARERGVVLGQAELAELDRLWDEVKRDEGRS
jgi:nucleoside triphosphate diphosphatase